MLPEEAATVNLFVFTSKLPSTPTASLKPAVPVTVNVPPTDVLPELDRTVNLLVFTSKLPSTPVACRFVAPPTVNVLSN